MMSSDRCNSLKGSRIIERDSWRRNALMNFSGRGLLLFNGLLVEEKIKIITLTSRTAINVAMALVESIKPELALR